LGNSRLHRLHQLGKAERAPFPNLKPSTPSGKPAIITNRAGTADFIRMLRAKFRDYRRQHFDGKDNMFRSGGDAVVFLKEHAAANLLVPPFASKEQRDRIVDMIPTNQRHRHFGSMQSSQAIAQSVFGTIASFNCLPSLTNVIAEDGRQAFSSALEKTTLYLERKVNFLG
jgi:hypothetical protein